MSGAVASVGMVAAAAMLTVTFATVASAAVHGQRLAGAADAAALAAADTASGAVVGFPCERAAEVASATGSVLTECAVDGLVATVTVSSRFGPMTASARARAGPPPS